MAKSSSGCKKWWKAWDFKENLKSLWSRDGRAIPQLDGFRLFACVWVIAYHVSGIARLAVFLNTPFDKLQALVEEFKHHVWGTWWYKLILAGDMGVDIFFVLSGLLIAYILMSEVDRYQKSEASKVPTQSCKEQFQRCCGGIRYFRFLLRRWLRLMPAFLLSMPTTALKPQLWEKCQEWWWPNLLLINNFVGPGTVVTGCLAQSWSIAMEFQFYIVSPLFIVLAVQRCFHDPSRGKYQGWLMFFLLLVLSVLIRVVILFLGDPEFKTMISHVHGAGIPRPGCFLYFYSKTYARFGPYILGMMVAYLYRYNLKTANQLLQKRVSKSPKPYGFRCCCDGRRVFNGYITLREAACRPSLCCSSRFDAKEEDEEGLQVVSLNSNPAAADDFQAPLLDVPIEVQRPRSGLPSRSPCVTAMWALLGTALMAFGFCVAETWAYASPLTTYKVLGFPAIVDPVSDLNLRRFMFITWRTLFSATTAFLVLLCLIQRGTWIDWFFSWHGWVPLARLTYSAYLLQFFPISMDSLNFVNDVYQQHVEHLGVPAAFMLSYVSYFLVILVITFSMSFVMYMLAEKPVMNLRVAQASQGVVCYKYSSQIVPHGSANAQPLPGARLTAVAFPCTASLPSIAKYLN